MWLDAAGISMEAKNVVTSKRAHNIDMPQEQ